jgi:hypothetical protein
VPTTENSRKGETVGKYLKNIVLIKYTYKISLEMQPNIQFKFKIQINYRSQSAS